MIHCFWFLQNNFENHGSFYPQCILNLRLLIGFSQKLEDICLTGWGLYSHVISHILCRLPLGAKLSLNGNFNRSNWYLLSSGFEVNIIAVAGSQCKEK